MINRSFGNSRRRALGLLCGWLLVGCATPGGNSARPAAKESSTQTIRAQADRKGLPWDLQVGGEAYDQQLDALRKKKIPLDNDAVLVARLTRVMNRLTPHALISDLPYRLHYVDHETVNAVCYLGGGILFFRGLFDPKKGLVNQADEDEIAAVMGHEIAHATLRHSYKTYRKASTIGFFGRIVSIFIGSAGGQDWQSLFDTIFDLGTGLYFPSYSRKNEAAADLEGMFTMMAAGYNPERAIALWERAASKKGGGKTSIFASHPASGARAKALRIHLENIRRQGKGPAS